MNVNRILQVAFIIGILAILGIAGFYGYQQQLLLRAMTIKFTGATFDSVTFTNVIMRLKLKFTNKSDISITVSSYDFDVLINGRKVVDVISPGPGVILPRTDSVNTLSINFDPRKVLSNLFAKDTIGGIFTDYSKVMITIKGVISVSHAGIGISDIPIEQTSTLQDLME